LGADRRRGATKKRDDPA